jgi:hypothetical protein
MKGIAGDALRMLLESHPPFSAFADFPYEQKHRKYFL